MIGAIIGDINGSKYEFRNIHTKDFELFQKDMHPTDDSLLTIAVMQTFNRYYLEPKKDTEDDEFKKNLTNPEWQKSFKLLLVNNFVHIASKKYSFNAGFGGNFNKWLGGYNGFQPYGSYGNGSAMRVSPVGFVADSEKEVKLLSRLVSEITHNHPEGLKGAEATAMAIYLARTGVSKEAIKERIIKDYYPEIATFDYNDLVKNYKFSEACQYSVPQALYCFLISKDFEDCIKTTISIGGDCDTTAAISCAVAGAYYGIPKDIHDKTIEVLGSFSSFLKEVVVEFENKFSK